MSIKSDIINALEKNRGKPVSGQQLADELGVSRAAVWKGGYTWQVYGTP